MLSQRLSTLHTVTVLSCITYNRTFLERIGVLLKPNRALGLLKEGSQKAICNKLIAVKTRKRCILPWAETTQKWSCETQIIVNACNWRDSKNRTDLGSARRLGPLRDLGSARSEISDLTEIRSYLIKSYLILFYRKLSYLIDILYLKTYYIVTTA